MVIVKPDLHILLTDLEVGKPLNILLVLFEVVYMIPETLIGGRSYRLLRAVCVHYVSYCLDLC